MERSVVDRGTKIDHRIAGEETTQPRILDAFFNRGNELTWDRAAENVDHELELAAPWQRFEPHLAVAELSVAAGLLLVPPVRFGGRGNRFTIRDPRKLQ